jgi:hypothetical protein
MSFTFVIDDFIMLIKNIKAYFKFWFTQAIAKIAAPSFDLTL